MIRRPPRSTLDRSSAASDVYKRQDKREVAKQQAAIQQQVDLRVKQEREAIKAKALKAVSYTHLRAHETVLDIVCRLLLEKKKSPIISCVCSINYEPDTTAATRHLRHYYVYNMHTHI